MRLTLALKQKPQTKTRYSICVRAEKIYQHLKKTTKNTYTHSQTEKYLKFKNADKIHFVYFNFFLKKNTSIKLLLLFLTLGNCH